MSTSSFGRGIISKLSSSAPSFSAPEVVVSHVLPLLLALSSPVPPGGREFVSWVLEVPLVVGGLSSVRPAWAMVGSVPSSAVPFVVGALASATESTQDSSDW